jgi:diguanylate cyclase (GGDEF)-like protein
MLQLVPTLTARAVRMAGGPATTSDIVDLSNGAHISGSTTAVVVRWVRGQFGDEGVLQLLAEAGETRLPSQLEDAEEWSSYRPATALLEAAVRVTGRPDAARRIGEEMLTQHRGTAVVDLLRSLGSPEALLESIAQSGSKFSTVFTLTPREVSAGHAMVVGTTPPGVPRHRLLCDFTLGILSIIPTVFGLPPALVTQRECQARGGRECAYTLSWDTVPLVGQSEDQARVQRLEEQLDGVQMQLNAMRMTTAELVTTEDVGVALDLVTRRAGAAVRATRYLLAVTMPAEDRLRVHSCGLTQHEAQALAPTLLDQVSTPSRLVAEVASSTRRYGVLAAIFPAGATFFDQEQELFAAYAGYAANVLDTAWALEDARRQNETARALLDLSRSLAEVAAPHDVAQRLASAVPSVVDCDSASVLLWDEHEQVLRLGGSVNMPADVVATLSEVGVRAPDTPALGAMLSQLEPLFLHADGTDAYFHQLLQRSGSAAAVVVPIVGGRHFLGVVTAGVHTDTSRLERNPDLLERLEGLAHQAATALTNARLVGELQHQALHDSLTGLPNRLALVDNMEQTLARARREGTDCALLFLDLDGFKQVNDSRGHLAGDALLVQVTQRLQATARAGDTVARIGGDEFAVLLPALDTEQDAAHAATRIHAALCEPFDLGPNHPGAVTIGVSIGIGFGQCGHASSTQILQRADHAMYAAKAVGGGYVTEPRDAQKASTALPRDRAVPRPAGVAVAHH